MGVLFWGVVIFLAALSVHLILWRIRLPKAQTRTLLGVFGFTLLIGICALYLYPGKLFMLNNLADYLHLVIFYVSIMLAYIVTYSAIEVDSPSLVIVTMISQAGKEGLIQDRLAEMLNDDLLVKPRVRDLLRDGLAVLDADKYKLTRKGLIVAGVFDFYRGLLNTKKGG